MYFQVPVIIIQIQKDYVENSYFFQISYCKKFRPLIYDFFFMPFSIFLYYLTAHEDQICYADLTTNI